MDEMKSLDDFRKLLANYQPSEAAKAILRDTKLVAMVGLAGGGRSAVIRRLIATGKYVFFISDTTRPPKLRDGRLEQDGVDYFFRKPDDMLAEIKRGEFLEAEVIHNQQVSGVSIRTLERVNASGKIAIRDFEYGGAGTMARLKPDAFIIGLLPPSFEEWQRRWANREQTSRQEFLNRMQTAEKVFGKYAYQAVLHARRQRRSRHLRARRPQHRGGQYLLTSQSHCRSPRG